MKIAIISDIHNNTIDLQKVLDYCQKENIETIICCGDLASKETLDYLNDNFSGKIYYTFGNMDEGQLRDFEFTEQYKNTKIFKDFGELEIEKNSSSPLGGEVGRGVRIAFVHYPEKAKELCATGKYKFVFYGHTHKPWMSVAESGTVLPLPEGKLEGVRVKCTMLNPGNVAGEIYPPTFATWNTESGKFELIRIHDLK